MRFELGDVLIGRRKLALQREDVLPAADHVDVAARRPAQAAIVGRYLRDDNPVVPTSDRCRALAAVLRLPASAVMKQAGLALDGDWDVAAVPAEPVAG